MEQLNYGLEVYLRSRKGIWFLYAAGGLGLFGVFLGLFGKGKAAALVLLVAIVGPLAIMPPVALPGVLMFTGALPVAGLLALLLRPGPLTPLLRNKRLCPPSPPRSGHV